jgi:hypothetical protein
VISKNDIFIFCAFAVNEGECYKDVFSGYYLSYLQALKELHLI